MLNTESTILENWPGPKDTELPDKSTYHFALKQVGVNLDFHLSQFYRSANVLYYHFNSFEELVSICQRYPVDAIFIGGQDDFIKEIEMIRAIKLNVFLCIIPAILYHPDPDKNTVIGAFENGAEEFIYGEWVDRLVEVRIKRVLERNRRDLSINPSTFLPGPALIEREIARQIGLGLEFAVCYADLDNFKAYNDYYGYFQGDKVIQLTSRIVKDVVFDLCRVGFVGHIAGDDFIYIVPAELVDRTCTEIINAFDALIPYKYEPVDRERGTIITKNRRGEPETYSLLTISIAVIINKNRKFSHVGEMSKMLADLKAATKMKPGSNYMLERRNKY
ncbi:MAG: diguanylate cyclase [candidate division Zixibacteria bacterium]|nr:diguanylate cyclase [candidate division Zixibacteria bacterium]